MKYVMTFQKLISTVDIYMAIKTKFIFYSLSSNFFLISIFCVFLFMSFPQGVNALDADLGENLFKNQCAGCHLNGGNIIRRSKNLKLKSLNRNGIEDPAAIAKIARQGIGIMDGYKDQLGEKGDQVVANWIWEQAQKAWVQE